MPRSEEEYKYPEGITADAVTVELSQPASSASSSNHPFFSDKSKGLSPQVLMAN